MPDFTSEIRERLAGLGLAPEREAAIVEEVSQHLEDLVAELAGGGASPEEARAVALAQLDGEGEFARAVGRTQGGTRGEPAVLGGEGGGGRSVVAHLLYDARYALRSYRRRPVFAATIVMTLALAIGGSTGIFTVVDRVLLRPLSFPEPQELVQFMQTYPELGLNVWTLSQGIVPVFRDRMRSFSGFAGWTWRDANLSGDGSPERVSRALVTGEFFVALGVPAALGRTVGPDDDRPNRSDVVVLSDGFWRRRFAADPAIVGKTLRMEGLPVTVVGVMPPGFEFPDPAIEAWMPLGLDPDRLAGWFLNGVGRLKPGVTAEMAQREGTAVLWAAARENPQYIGRADPPHPGVHLGTLVTPLKEVLTGRISRPLLVLQGAMLLLLLIACANIATLLLARGSARAPEVTLRHALGASPARVTRQLFTESLVLSSAGVAAGAGVAWLVVRFISRVGPSGVPGLAHARLDWQTVAFAVALALMAGVLFGLAPALQSRRLTLTGALAEGARGGVHRSARRADAALVVVQFGLSIVLLIGSGLLLRSFWNLVSVDTGMRLAGVTTIALPSPGRATDPARVARFQWALVDSLRRVPSVQAVASASTLPFSGNTNSDGYLVEGREPPPNTGAEPQVIQVSVTPGYFAAVGIPLLRGRDFTDADRADGLQVVIVDESLARRFWPDGNALGHRVATTGDRRWLTIVGVSGVVRDDYVGDAPQAHFYLPALQAPARWMNIVARTDDEAGLVRRVRESAAAFDPDLPVPLPRALSSYFNARLSGQRLTSQLLAAFTALAVLLSAVGIYGVMSLWVGRRRRELAIRVALGARSAQLVTATLGEGLLLAGAGVVLGVLGALALSGFLRGLVYGLSPRDPMVYTLLPLGLVALALMAVWIPARRAGGSDPLEAMREG